MMQRIALIVLLIGQPFTALNHVAATQETYDAPKLALKDLKGRTARLDDFKGKVLLINFWATWCPPCRAEMPELVKLQNEYRARGLQVVGITYPPHNRNRVIRLARQLKVNYPILFGTRDTAALYEVGDILPVTIVVDREGKIRDRILGILDREEFEQKVAPLLR